MELLSYINGHDYQNLSNEEREKLIANVLKGAAECLIVLHERNLAYGPIETRYLIKKIRFI